uniref:Uncharacterized protein n=1 Tax=Arundo donax TaxID=35708 RepID=A0A0A8ZMM7_ARUDO
MGLLLKRKWMYHVSY